MEVSSVPAYLQDVASDVGDYVCTNGWLIQKLAVLVDKSFELHDLVYHSELRSGGVITALKGVNNFYNLLSTVQILQTVSSDEFTDFPLSKKIFISLIASGLTLGSLSTVKNWCGIDLGKVAASVGVKSPVVDFILACSVGKVVVVLISAGLTIKLLSSLAAMVGHGYQSLCGPRYDEEVRHRAQANFEREAFQSMMTLVDLTGVVVPAVLTLTPTSAVCLALGVKAYGIFNGLYLSPKQS